MKIKLAVTILALFLTVPVGPGLAAAPRAEAGAAGGVGALVIERSTFLGGDGVEVGVAAVVTPNGDPCIAGCTYSDDFPGAPGSTAAGADVFVSRFSSAGMQLLCTAILRGSGYEYVTDLVSDGDGNLYVAGSTNSPDFPVLHAFQPSLGGYVDAFVTKLSPEGTLLWSTYLGGVNEDVAYALAFGPDGVLTLVGRTLSPDFPSLPNPTPFHGLCDAFVARVRAADGVLLRSAFLGGSQWDQATDVKVGPSGHLWVAGSTRSPDFPVLNAYQSQNAGEMDAFLVKLDPSATLIVSSTFLGGSRDDQAIAVELDPLGRVYLGGVTGSDDFPTQDALQGNLAGASDAFVTCFSSGAASLHWSSYLGGSNYDNVTDLVVKSPSAVAVIGQTVSPDFPLKESLPRNFSLSENLFLCEVSPADGALGAATLLDTAVPYKNTNRASIGADGSCLLAASASTPDFPLAEPYQTALRGESDAVLVQVGRGARGLLVPHIASTPDWRTRITLVNLSGLPRAVTFTAYAEDGTLLETRAAGTLPALGSRTFDAGEVFGPEVFTRGAWAKIFSTGDLRGVVVFGTRDGRAQTSLPLFSDGACEWVFPFVAETGPWYTGLTLVGTGSFGGLVQLHAHAENGALLGTTPVNLAAGGKYVRLVREIFPGLDPEAVRMVRVTSDQPLVGFELFGNWASAGLSGLAGNPPGPRWEDASAAGHPASAAPARGDSGFRVCTEVPPEGDYYTSATFCNLEPSPMRFLASLIDANGLPLAEKLWTVGPYEQVSREVRNLVGEGEPCPPGSYLALVGEGPGFAGFELFMTRSGAFGFDGFPALLPGGARLIFPLASLSPEETAGLRIHALGGAGNLVFHAFGSNGEALGSARSTVAAMGLFHGTVAGLFPGVAEQVAWIAVQGTQPLVGEMLLASPDGSRMVCYPAVPGSPCGLP
ncbi:MAG: SBBP repeat-containing protein [Acidobacteria bacterium]|nr:SBBP repeat-containing protein [Acidobacteriota bacterium]